MAKIKDQRITLTLTLEQMAALGPTDFDLADWLETALRGIAALRSVGPLGARSERLLQESSALIERLEGVRAAALREHALEGASVRESGIAMGVSKATAQSRRNARHTPAELWARGMHGEAGHPGTPVPDALRSWSVAWPGYTPVDITGSDLMPERGLAASVAEGWAEGYATPNDIDTTELLARARNAVLPYDHDDRFWPLNPTGRTGRTGRNLGRWGENTAADSIVIAGVGVDRRILLIKRDDVHQWAIPGGMVNPGELAKAALVRELREETGVDLAGLTPQVLGSQHVKDWRESDHAWVVTTVAIFTLPTEVTATAADDAADAQWLPFADLAALETALAEQGQVLYPAHRSLLELALTRLSTAGDERRNTTTKGTAMDELDRKPGETCAD